MIEWRRCGSAEIVDMDRDEAIKLLTGGQKGVRAWNKWREEREDLPNLSEADLSEADLRGADLREADRRVATLFNANLSRANLYRAHLVGADLSCANLNGANLSYANLTGADLNYATPGGANFSYANLSGGDLSHAALSEADLRHADLSEADLRWADLSGANLGIANLSDADLSDANLRHADLSGAILSGAILRRANLSDANLREASCWSTVFANVDLSNAKGLDSVTHIASSTVGIDTLFRSMGKIPEAFLRGCGLTPWEILAVRPYGPELTPAGFAEIQYQVFDAWTRGRSMINGCFVSYSHSDANFVDKLRDRLYREGVNVWLDRHDIVAGTIQEQVWRAIQFHHVVIMVLSKDSVRSDWVENELDMARNKEKAEARAVLCPISVDDAWKAKIKAGPGEPSRQLWRTLQQKLVVDFSRWKTTAFEDSFQKLLRGLKTNFGPA
jgi:uncharacterized protein YjbI with pentapeptide repeats